MCIYVFDAGGEVATIVAGLKYGQYVSQYDARALTTGDQLQQYLIDGVLDKKLATALKLNYTTWEDRTVNPTGYLTWLKLVSCRGD